MSRYELKLPKMGESVAEATITSWLKEVGDKVELDDSIVEIATDKVDSDVPSDVDGVLIEQKFGEGDIVKVGEVIAIIETDSKAKVEGGSPKKEKKSKKKDKENFIAQIQEQVEGVIQSKSDLKSISIENSEGKFYSPLVKKIAETEGISQEELDNIKGSGLEDRVTKEDILTYIEVKKTGKLTKNSSKEESNIREETIEISEVSKVVKKIDIIEEKGDELVTLSRMGKMISDHMIHSKQKAAHVQSFIEVDVTNIVQWRNKVKDEFLKREGEKLTYTPIFMLAVAQAIKKYPLVNLTFDGIDKVVVKKSINLGMAAALPDGNLIVPVIKNAENLNLIGMTKVVNDLALRSKNNQLKPDDVKGGTYTVTNIGGFGSIFGTPIINQPECAILAIGAIRKVPAVIETKEGDFIGIRHKMYLSHSYDHRVINGALGGMLIKEIKDYLEAWSLDTKI